MRRLRSKDAGRTSISSIERSPRFGFFRASVLRETNVTSGERPGLLEIGVIGRPHGVRGEVKVRLHFEGSQALEHAQRVLVDPVGGSPRHFDVEAVRGRGKQPILAFSGIEERDAAEQLRGAVVWVERSALPPPEPDEYYLVDLVGCRVILEGREIGVVEAVRPDPSVDTMVIRLASGKRAEQPIVDVWMGKVDVEQKTVELIDDGGLVR